MTDAGDAELAREADILARYVVGRAPGADVVARYGAASRGLWPGPPAPGDAARLAFVRRHPWSIGPLDAAAALLDPGGLLRGKVLVASAILETTTAHADAFLPRATSLPALLWRLAASGVAGAAHAAVGLVLWRVAGRVRA